MHSLLKFTSKVQKLELMFVKGLRHVSYESFLHRLRLFSLVHKQIYYKMAKGLFELT